MTNTQDMNITLRDATIKLCLERTLCKLKYRWNLQYATYRQQRNTCKNDIAPLCARYRFCTWIRLSFLTFMFSNKFCKYQHITWRLNNKSQRGSLIKNTIGILKFKLSIQHKSGVKVCKSRILFYGVRNESLTPLLPAAHRNFVI